MLKRVFIAAVLGGCVIWAGCGDTGPAPRDTAGGGRGGAAADRNLPKGAGGASLFRLPMTDGQPVTVKTPAALFFFTTWCGYCKQAMPEIKNLAEKAHSRGWRVYGIDVNESPAQVAGFIQQYQPNFPVLLDQQSAITGQYDVRGFPTFVLIDQNANIIYQGHSVPKNF